jgi:hypothetical protein
MKRQLAEHEKLTPEQRGALVIPAIGSIAGGAALWDLGGWLGWRHLPHVPFDLSPFEHIGNVWPTLPAAFAAPILAALVEKYVSADQITKISRIVAAGTIGLALGAVLNATTETKFGNDHIGRYLPLIDYKMSVPLVSDFIWGTASAVIVAGGLAAWRDRKLAANQKAYLVTIADGGIPSNRASDLYSSVSITSTKYLSEQMLLAMHLIPSDSKETIRLDT